MLSRIVESSKGLLSSGHATRLLKGTNKVGRLRPFRAYGGFFSRNIDCKVKTASIALVGDFSTAIILSHSGARTALPMGVAPEIKLNCLQLRLNSIFPSVEKPAPNGSKKKRLKISESQLALLNLLCTRPVWLTDLSFAQLVELTVLLLHSNVLVESAQLLELTVSLLHSNELAECSIGLLDTPPPVTSVMTFPDALCVRWGMTEWAH